MPIIRCTEDVPKMKMYLTENALNNVDAVVTARRGQSVNGEVAKLQTSTRQGIVAKLQTLGVQGTGDPL